MGIPRFYRWLSERYPLINENIAAEQIPEFDNLYLDMNGIIHNCSHNNTGGLCVKEESDVFVEAFKYVSHLFRIIRPKKLFYMAVDGCAPRAKMNQQRSRRFRAANEAREAREKAEEMGEVIEGTAFDSNCITPGTEFMAKLTEHLRYFVCAKIQEDPLWREVRVVLSGPDEPGEGEHKIMDYIRASKAQPGYAANLRHCLYGLDADLIMLALASHEPHFALLREEVIFGKQSKEDAQKKLAAPKDPATDRFQLLHVSLLREYLDLEFRPPPGNPLPFTYNLERLIDDFILVCVLVGNDFLPSLPFAEINDGGLDDFFTIYKEHLRRAMRGQPPWITYDCGRVEYEQLARFLRLYAKTEEQKLEGIVDLGEYVLGRRRTMGSRDAPDPPAAHFECLQDPPASAQHAREQYYNVKFGIDANTHQGTQQQRGLFQAYLEGLQWVLLYYYRGPGSASWSWFYPYYHAPMAVDLAEYDKLTRPSISFDVGEPFLPFQQLMAVLPSNSKTLLPKCFQWLFDSPTSPIVDFYPQKFEIDMDGVKVPWGGVTLIPWIEQGRLIEAMAEAERRGPALTLAEEARNRIGEAYSFRYEESFTIEVKSPMPHRFESLTSCQVRSSVFKHPPLPPGMAHFINDVLPGFRPQASGFPTLHVHPLTCAFETGVKVFQYEARGKSLIVRLRPRGPQVLPEEELRRLLRAARVRVDFPFVHFGQVVAVHTAEKIYFPDGKTAPNSAKEHEYLVRQLLLDWRRRGVALDLDAGAGGPGDAAAGRGRRGGNGSVNMPEDLWRLPVAEVRLAEATALEAAEGRRQHKSAVTGQHRLVHLISADEQQASDGAGLGEGPAVVVNAAAERHRAQQCRAAAEPAARGGPPAASAERPVREPQGPALPWLSPDAAASLHGNLLLPGRGSTNGTANGAGASATERLKSKVTAKLSQTLIGAAVDTKGASTEVAPDGCAEVARASSAQPARAAEEASKHVADKDRRAAGSKQPQSYYAFSGGDGARGRHREVTTSEAASSDAASKGHAASASAGGAGKGRGRGAKGGTRETAPPARQQANASKAAGGTASATAAHGSGGVDWKKAFDDLLALGPKLPQ